MNQVVKAKVDFLPAATHIDATCRVQTVNRTQNSKYYTLIEELGRQTGIPVVLNTSFNLKDQTMVLTPEDAIKTFLNCEMDILILGSYVVKKKIL